MQAQHVLRALRGCGDGVHIQVRGVGGQHRTGACVGIDLCKHLLLDRQVFKHRFDHQIGLRQLRPIDRGVQVRFARGGHARLELAGSQAAAVVLGYVRRAARQGDIVLLQQQHAQAGVQRADGDARPHGASADHSHGLHAARQRL